MIAYVFQKYPENFAFQLFIILKQLTREICHFVKKIAYFLTVSIVFPVYKKKFTVNNLKTTTAMNAKISMFAIGVKAVKYS